MKASKHRNGLPPSEGLGAFGASAPCLFAIDAGASRSPQVIDFSIDLQVSEPAPRQLRIVSSTNLPDGAIILLSVGRLYDETITDTYLPEKVEAIVDVDDRVWMKQRAAKAAKLKPAGMILSPMRNIRPEVEVQAFFTPLNKEQPEHVLRITGKRGELLKGRAAKAIGDRTTLEAIQHVPLPVGA